MWKTETRWHCPNRDCLQGDIRAGNLAEVMNERRCACGWLLVKQEVTVFAYLEFLRSQEDREEKAEVRDQ